MKKLLKQAFAILLLLVVLVPSLGLPAYAATPTGYTEADDVNYVTHSGKYISNWGVRDETCVFLSKYALNFYTGSYTYDNLSTVKGGTGTNNATSSALYQQLMTLMDSKQTYETSYGATRDLFKYTDCEKNNTSIISTFYVGKQVDSDWDGGQTWNREHVWPNSKGDASGNGENDIMMLRPADARNNSSRGNKAFGLSSGFYDPNSLGQNVRGDCARILLYVYVRWTNPNLWGSSGIIENLDTLLAWMEEDPVDTWEMGRNDAVQSITGTRNVFVDYPEYAWLLFGREIPSDMTTPSGEAADGNGNQGGSGDQGGNGNQGGGNQDETPLTPNTLITIKQAIGLGASQAHDVHTSDKYYVSGVITEIKNAEWGNMILSDDEGNSLLIYGTYSADGSTRYDKLVTKPAVGDTVTVYGVIGQYYDTPQMKNGWITSHTPAGSAPCTHGNTRIEGAEEPTETQPGYTGNTVCVDCGATVSRGQKIPAKGEEACKHTDTRVEGAKEATYTEPGYTGDTVCVACGATVTKGTDIPVKECHHENSETRNARPAGCGDGYSGDIVCSDCGKLLDEGDVIKGNGNHRFGDWATYQKPTEEEIGLEKRVCLDCGHKEERAVPRLQAKKDNDSANLAWIAIFPAVFLCCIVTPVLSRRARMRAEQEKQAQETPAEEQEEDGKPSDQA